MEFCKTSRPPNIFSNFQAYRQSKFNQDLNSDSNSDCSLIFGQGCQKVLK